MEYERLSKLLEYTPDDSELVKQLSYLIDITLYRRYPVKIDKKPAKYITKEDRINGNIYIDEDYLVSYSLKYELRQKKKRAELITKAQSMMKKPGKYQATFFKYQKNPDFKALLFLYYNPSPPLSLGNIIQYSCHRNDVGNRNLHATNLRVRTVFLQLI